MARGDEITTKFTIDISDLKKGISDANQQIKLANAQFKAASAGMDDWAKSADGINAKLKQLDSVLAAEKQKLSAYQQELERNKQAYAENGSRAEQLKAKLQELANQGVSKTSAEYKKYESELASVEKEQEKNKNAIDKLNVQILKQEAAVNGTEKEIRNYGKQLEELDNDQEDAAKSADNLGKEVEQAGKDAKSAEGGFSVLKGALADLASKAVSAGIDALKEFGAAAKEAVLNTAEYGDAIQKNSQKVGLSYEAYQKWDYAMQLAGTSMDKMGAGMKKLTTSVDSAINGSSSAAANFERLGISVDDLAGKSREDIFGMVVTQLQNVSDETEKAALANKFFGKSGTDLIPLLNQTAEETQNAIQQAEEYGMVMGDDAVDASADFQDALTLLNGTVDGLKRTLAGEFLAGLTDVITGLADLARGAEGAGAKVGEALGNVVKQGIQKITQMLPELGRMAVELVSSLATGILDAAPELVTTALELVTVLVQGIGQALPLIVNKAVEIIPALVQGLLSGTEQLLQAGLQLLMGIVQAIPSFVASLVEALPQIISTITGFLTTAVPMLIDGGIQLFYALIEAIPQVLPPLLAALPQIITSLVEFFIRQKETFMQAAVQLLMGLVGAIPEVVIALVAALPDIIQAILDGLSDIPSLLKDLFLSAWEGIKSVFSGVGDFFKSIFGKGKKNIEDEWSTMGTWAKDKNKEIEKGFETTDKFFGDKFAASATAMDKSFAEVGTWSKGKRKEVDDAFATTDTMFGNKFADAATAMDTSFQNVGSWAEEKRGEVNNAFETTDTWFGSKYRNAADEMDKSFAGVEKWAQGKREKVNNAFDDTDRWFGNKYDAAAAQMDKSFSSVGSWAQSKRESVDKAFESTDTFFKGKFDSAKANMDSSWADVGSWSEGKVESMEKPFEKVDSWFGKKFGEAYKAITDQFSGWDSFWDGLYNTLVSKFGSIGTQIGSAIGSSFKSAMNAAMAAAQNAVNRGIDSINTAIGQMNAIQGVSVGRVGYVSFPRMAKGGVLKKGQIGFLEGDGAEAVVPLDQNKKWISAVADDMSKELNKKSKKSSGGSGSSKEVKKLTKELEEQEKVLDSYTEKLSKQEQAYIKNGHRMDELRAKLQVLSDKGVSETSEEYIKYQEALERTEEKQDKLERSIARLSDKIGEEKEAIKQTKDEIALLDGTMQENVVETKQAAAAAGELTVSEDAVDKKVEQLSATLESQQNRLDSYKKKLSETEVAYVNNAAKIDELKAKLEELKKKGVSETSAEYQKYQEQLDYAVQKQDYLQKSVDALNISIDYEQTVIQRTNGELSKYQGMQESNAHAAALQSEAVQKIISDMEAQGQTTDDLQFKLSELNAELDAQQAKYEMSSSKLQKQTAALEAQTAKVDLLKEKMQQLADDGVSETDAKYVKYAEKLEKAEAHQAKLEESVGKLVSSTQKQEKSMENTNEQINNYQLALEALGVEQATASKYAEDQTKTNDSLAKQDATLATASDNLTTAVSGTNSAYDQAAKLIVNLDTELKKLVDKYISAAVKALGDLSKGFTSLRKPVNDAMTQFGQLETKLNTLYNNIVSKFKNIGQTVATGIGDSFKQAMNAAMKAAEEAVNKGIDSINVAIDQMNAIDGVSVDKIKKAKFPQLASGGILRRGQIGVLEGSGAEAVVPLDKNKLWIAAVANDMLDALRVDPSVTNLTNNKEYNFTQIINAPKAPSRIELYRQTRNLLAYTKGVG